MTTIKRVLLIVNRTAGTGRDGRVADRLRAILADSLGERVSVEVALVNDHPTARTCANDFLNASVAPAAIIVGGGGGTLRACIEGVCDGSEVGRLPDARRVRLGALRLGSGNVLAKQLGVPKDVEAGLRGIVANMRADRTVPCCIMRCEVGTRMGEPEIRYAATLGGFGQFGRTSGDLARWHGRWPTPRKLTARLFGIEKVNHVEYATALLIRSISCALFPRSVETVEVHAHGRKRVMRLLSGVAMNFPFDALPFSPGVEAGDEALSLHLIPLDGRLWPLLQVLAPRRIARRAQEIRIGKRQRVEIRFVDPDCVEFFLDEDPTIAHRRLTLEVAGSLAFVPGPDYSFAKGRFTV